MHKLVIIKHKKAFLSKKTDKYTVEETNQEDKIKFINNFSPQTNHYIYSIILNNFGSSPISEVKIKVLSPKFLSYLRCLPPTINNLSFIEINEEEVINIEVSLGELREKNSQEIYLHFTPSISPATGEFKTIITYANNKGNMKILTSKPIKVQIDNIILTPKIILSSQIREFSQSPGIIRVLMSFGIGKSKKVKLNQFFDTIEHIFQSQNLQLISKDKERGILWFCGTDMQSNNDILTFSKIGSNQMDIMLYSKNPIILASFLFSFTKMLKEQQSIKKFFKSKIQILELVCSKCGTILPYLPGKGEIIKCNKCNYEQFVW